NEFEATSMQQNHGFGNTPALFHTGSFAEYHEYDLRCLLATYVAQLTCASDTESEDAARNIMTDDKSFVSAVQTYKHVVTQYFAAKTEIWMTLFMKPVFGVTGGNLVNEFAKARGAIHFHSCLQSAHRALDVCSRQICHLSLAVADALMEVDEYINEHYDDNDHKSADFPIKPSTIFTTDGMSERQRFCNVTEVGEAVMDKYEKTVKKARIECQSVVGKSLMKDFGYNACHTGNGPGDYIQPVGLKTDDYMQHEDEDGKRMQTSKDVVDRKQLKRKRTRGAPRVDAFELGFDNNGQAKPVPVRNHGRVVAHTYGARTFGANTDTQFILMPKHYNDMNLCDGDGNPLPLKSRSEIEHMSNLLCAAGKSGLDPSNSLHIVNRYLTSYCCKGNQSSGHWRDAARAVINDYCSKGGNENKTLHSVVAKVMLDISQSISVSRDQASFMATQGIMKRSSLGEIKKCSVSSVLVREMGSVLQQEQPNAAPDSSATSSFNLPNIFRRYKNRPASLSHLSIYDFVIRHWKMGNQLPWRSDPTEVLAGQESYAIALEMYLREDTCRVPHMIWNEILRVQRKERAVVVDSSAAVSGVAGNAGALSPTDERTDPRLESAVDEIPQLPGGENPYDIPDFDENLVRQLRQAPSHVDWHAGHNQANHDSLNEYVVKRRAQLKARSQNTDEEPIVLYNEELYRPENVKTFEQRFLVFHSMYHHWLRWIRKNDPNVVEERHLPNDLTQLVWVEGLPGMSNHHTPFVYFGGMSQTIV
ncbi:hypothetical protein THAOC_36777, partial [Thalassiosira oceanica]